MVTPVEYFCDRVEETLHITEMLTNENNMALISPRRIGKTELIHHCFAQPVIQKDYYTFIIDIYSNQFRQQSGQYVRQSHY